MKPIDTPVAQDGEPYAFVCYAHDDADIVYGEIEWLVQQGVKVWYDKGISAGTNWRSVIGDSLLGARQLLYFVSERSLSSEHCNREVSLALDEGISILPVYLQDVELTSDLKIGLGRVQALKFDGPDYRAKLLSGLGQTETGPIQPRATQHLKPARRYFGLGAGIALIATLALLLTYGPYNPLGGRADKLVVTSEVTVEALETIAVLPFISLSEQASVGFSKGLSDGILDELAQGDLGVASRTASFDLASQGVTLQAIAEQLKVAYVLD